MADFLLRWGPKEKKNEKGNWLEGLVRSSKKAVTFFL